MPTYDYKCDACGHRFEAFQSIKDDALTKCPSCGNFSIKRIISAGGGLIFKGSGYYITDYKNQNASYTAAAKKDAPTSAADSKSKSSDKSSSSDSSSASKSSSSSSTPKKASE